MEPKEHTLLVSSSLTPRPAWDGDRIGASGVWMVQGLPGRGHRTDSRDECSLGERKRHLKKDSGGGGNVQGACSGRVQTRTQTVTANTTMRSREPRAGNANKVTFKEYVSFVSDRFFFKL